VNTSESQKNLLRQLPSVHRLLAHSVVAQLSALPATLLTDSARAVLERYRAEIGAASGSALDISEDALAQQVAAEAMRRATPSLQSAINATGIVLHTGLGRARLSEVACSALMEVAHSHSLLEIDRETGQRGSRRDHVRALLKELTGAEEATVVNNCAGAVFLAVTALATGREVLISRGELVEIGGAFRMPDIIRASGATLIEVGTTNRTRLSDYAGAITERTGLILRCHPSNFALIGFTEETPIGQLVALGRERGIPVLDDQGSGALLRPDQLGLPGVKGSLRESVSAGCDLITASGDKLLGGPQAGLILGRRELVERIAQHPLARALRVDKFTLAALEATLRLYREPTAALEAIPTLRYLTRTPVKLRSMAQRLSRQMRNKVDTEQFIVATISERSQVGGGSLPGEDLPTTCVSLRSRTGKPSPDAIAAALRRHKPAIFTRIREDAVLLDVRTLEESEFSQIVAAVRALSEC
jgi:L-seryl-tRNA(Ser) seleniumtransferase